MLPVAAGLQTSSLHGPVVFDLAATSGLRCGAVAFSALDGARACADYEERKRSHLDTAAVCRQQGFQFVPLIAEAVRREAIKTFRSLGSLLAARTGDSAASATEHLLLQHYPSEGECPCSTPPPAGGGSYDCRGFAGPVSAVPGFLFRLGVWGSGSSLISCPTSPLPSHAVPRVGKSFPDGPSSLARVGLCSSPPQPVQLRLVAVLAQFVEGQATRAMFLRTPRGVEVFNCHLGAF